MELPQLQAYFDQHPRSPLFARLALEYLYAGRTNEAIDLCRTGITNFPEYATGHLVLAKCYAQEMSFALAISSLQEAKKYLPVLPVYEKLISEWTSFLASPPLELPTKSTGIQKTETRESTNPEVESPGPVIGEMGIAETGIRESESLESTSPAIETPEPEIQEIKAEEPEIQEQVIQESTGQEVESPGPETQEIGIAEEVIRESEPGGSTNQEVESPGPDIQEATPPVPETHGSEVQEKNIQEPEIKELNESLLPSIESEPVVPPVEEAQVPPGISGEEYQQIQRPPSEDSDEWRIVSRTLAEIFATQGEYDEAIITYRLLIRERPDLSSTFQSRIDELIKLREAKILAENEQKSPDAPGLS